ncbi:solute carrier organic anion transporter family member 2A1 [Scomber japonicus]|uniref:solute carrier organic anion transporter family member 2A1 n=1 Tax=Scomber japonicus TaxID=13676 RepID=UPI0023061455|nr:solute carrier organic anion transporter family member 2A1 [Scomber japonicus]
MDFHSPKDMKRPRTQCRSIKLFVLCHGLLQFSQLLYSSYFKSIITTIERRYGLSSYSSGTISSLHEISNSLLIVFVSYFGNRVHRPRVIGIGGLMMSVSAMLLTLPHFVSQSYNKDYVMHNRQDICNLQGNSSNLDSCGRDESRFLTDSNNLWLLMASAQLLFGLGSVPIQPFGISYIDDFAGPANSPLYIAILFALSVFGPAIGYLLGSVMLRIYVDVDTLGLGGQPGLRPGDPRWVGAWWIGLLITASILFLTSIPYFFFPRSMPSEENVIGDETDVSDDFKKPDVSLLDFLKMFPRMFVHLLLSPLFLMLILAQCCFSSVIAGLATFLNKFLQLQYSTSAAYSSLLVGALNLPAVAVGMLLGGIIMKKVGLSLKTIPRFSVVMLTMSTLLCIPLFFMGCSTQKVAEVNFNGSDNSQASKCYSNCSCPQSAFNPVCGSNGIEYISPCHAGCTSFIKDSNNTHRVKLYTNCSCISGQGNAQPGPCPNSCPHLLLPAMLVISLASLVACLTHNPLYMMVLRSVPSEEKSFAIGVQFLLMRVLAWLPAPAIFGKAIDSSCVWWKYVCGKKFNCGYYDNNFLRNRYLGLQVGYKVMGLVLLAMLGWKVQRTQEYSLEKRPEPLL